jgi:hypothetical protein
MDYLKPKMTFDLGSGNVKQDDWDRIFKRCPTCKLPKDDGPFCQDAFHLDNAETK